MSDDNFIPLFERLLSNVSSVNDAKYVFHSLKESFRANIIQKVVPFHVFVYHVLSSTTDMSLLNVYLDGLCDAASLLKLSLAHRVEAIRVLVSDRFESLYFKKNFLRLISRLQRNKPVLLTDPDYVQLFNELLQKYSSQPRISFIPLLTLLSVSSPMRRALLKVLLLEPSNIFKYIKKIVRVSNIDIIHDYIRSNIPFGSRNALHNATLIAKEFKIQIPEQVIANMTSLLLDETQVLDELFVAAALHVYACNKSLPKDRTSEILKCALTYAAKETWPGNYVTINTSLGYLLQEYPEIDIGAVVEYALSKPITEQKDFLLERLLKREDFVNDYMLKTIGPMIEMDYYNYFFGVLDILLEKPVQWYQENYKYFEIALSDVQPHQQSSYYLLFAVLHDFADEKCKVLAEQLITKHLQQISATPWDIRSISYFMNALISYCQKHGDIVQLYASNLFDRWMESCEDFVFSEAIASFGYILLYMTSDNNLHDRMEQYINTIGQFNNNEIEKLENVTTSFVSEFRRYVYAPDISVASQYNFVYFLDSMMRNTIEMPLSRLELLFDLHYPSLLGAGVVKALYKAYGRKHIENELQKLHAKHKSVYLYCLRCISPFYSIPKAFGDVVFLSLN